MNIIEKAFCGLYPNRQMKHSVKIKYSGKFGKYNANIRYTNSEIEFGLSKEWRAVDPDIRMGLLQSLMNKAFNTKKSTINIDLYNIFIRNVHTAIPKIESHPILEKAFNRVNERYFLGLVEKPNLAWGRYSTAKLGSYDYHSDTVSVSKIFEESESELLEYIIFHELLHKMHKFKITNGRTLHHSSLFKKHEKEFENSEIIEKQLSLFIRHWKHANPKQVIRKKKKRFRFF